MPTIFAPFLWLHIRITISGVWIWTSLCTFISMGLRKEEAYIPYRPWLRLCSPEVWFPQSVACDPEWDGETARQSLPV